MPAAKEVDDGTDYLAVDDELGLGGLMMTASTQRPQLATVAAIAFESGPFHSDRFLVFPTELGKHTMVYDLNTKTWEKVGP